MQQAGSNGEEDMEGGFGGGGGLAGDLGGDMDMDLGEPGASEEGDLGGDMGETDMSNAPGADAGEPLMENRSYIMNITNKKKRDNKSTGSKYSSMLKTYTSQYFDLLAEGYKEDTNVVNGVDKLNHHIVTINNTIEEVCSKIDSLVNEEELEKEQILEEAIENTKDIN